MKNLRVNSVLKKRMLAMLCVFCCMSTTTFAAKHVFPRGCDEKGFSFSQSHLLLKPVYETLDQTLFLFYNRSRDTIQIKHVNQGDPVLAPNWNTTINPGHWSAFATDVRKTTFQCRTAGFAESRPIDCQHALKVCQFPRAKFAEHNRGNYWISQNKSRRRTIRAANEAGILLRW